MGNNVGLTVKATLIEEYNNGTALVEIMGNEIVVSADHWDHI